MKNTLFLLPLLALAACTGEPQTLKDALADKILRLNVWGVQDGDSWKNEFPLPIPGREEAPLLFDRSYSEKPATRWVIENAKNY